MGLFSTNIARNSSRPPSYPFFVPRFFIIVAVISLSILIFFEVDSFVESVVSRSKTIKGLNLQPTPWHPFPPRLLDPESKYTTFSKIFKCSYFSCSRNTTYEVKEQRSNNETCPEVFKNIYKDLEPWAKSKITFTHVTEAQKFASFRVTIIGGKMYVDLYYDCVQSRQMFTIWSFLQLLRRYPGKIPDVDLMFDCMDKPMIHRANHSSMPVPLFRYCTTAEHFDIPFPDWSFWGWSEINIQPWEEEFRSIKQGSQAKSWSKKWPFAYWKGNPDVSSPVRTMLLECNDTAKWKAQILRQFLFE